MDSQRTCSRAKGPLPLSLSLYLAFRDSFPSPGSLPNKPLLALPPDLALDLSSSLHVLSTESPRELSHPCHRDHHGSLLAGPLLLSAEKSEGIWSIITHTVPGSQPPAPHVHPQLPTNLVCWDWDLPSQPEPSTPTAQPLNPQPAPPLALVQPCFIPPLTLSFSPSLQSVNPLTLLEHSLLGA